MGAVSFGLETPMPDFMDPRDLTQAERYWLGRVNMFRHYRRRGGYGIIGEPQILSLKMASRLIGKRLIIFETVGGKQTVRLTGKGLNIVAVLDERARRKQEKATA